MFFGNLQTSAFDKLFHLESLRDVYKRQAD